MHFGMKNTLRSNRNHTSKQAMTNIYYSLTSIAKRKTKKKLGLMDR